MTFRHFSITLAVISAFSSQALAGETTYPVRVLELFTSQGCSSCPPANIFAGELSRDEETLVLSYGVTYWDYLGWKDTFAKPEFTKRQKNYSVAFDSTNVYTPQMIINGSAHSPFYAADDVRSMTLPDETLDLSVSETAKGFEITAPRRGANRTFTAVLVEYVPGPQSIPVARGENGGRVLTVSNVVTDIFKLGTWDLQGTLTSEIKLHRDKAYAVLLHDTETMRLETAARFTPNSK